MFWNKKLTSPKPGELWTGKDQHPPKYRRIFAVTDDSVTDGTTYPSTAKPLSLKSFLKLYRKSQTPPQPLADQVWYEQDVDLFYPKDKKEVRVLEVIDQEVHFQEKDQEGNWIQRPMEVDWVHKLPWMEFINTYGPNPARARTCG